MPRSPRGPSAPATGDARDLRTGPRVGIDFPLDLYTTDFSGPLPARTRDLGVGGLCLATASPFAVKGAQRVVLKLPGAALELPVEGVWQREARAERLVLSGLAFVDLPDAAVDRLWDVVLECGKSLARFLYARSSLRDFGVEEAMGLAQISRIRDLPAGGFLYHQDSSAPGEDSVFLVFSGSVVLQTRVRGAREIVFGRAVPGEICGGLPLFADVPHAESAVADGDVRLLEIDRDAWAYLRSTKPWLAHRLALAVTRTTARRLHDVFTRVRDHL